MLVVRMCVRRHFTSQGSRLPAASQTEVSNDGLCLVSETDSALLHFTVGRCTNNDLRDARNRSAY
jgi:hypothetical protein